MSGHSEDPVAEESKRFFTFFNLSMFLVAITGIEIVIIYVKTFDSSSIIGVLFATSIVKFIGVVWWFMHLKWDKVLNTILFLMGLVIALATYFAVIYMSDSHPVVEKFEVAKIEDQWKAKHSYKSSDFVLQQDAFFQAKSDFESGDQFNPKNWKKVKGIPMLFRTVLLEVPIPLRSTHLNQKPHFSTYPIHKGKKKLKLRPLPYSLHLQLQLTFA